MDLSTVLMAYPPAVAEARWTPLGNGGGFSGARVWRGVAVDGREYALKAHPPGADPNRLQRVHEWMRRGHWAGLEFVPYVLPPRYGDSTVREVGGRIWDACVWMPGRADFRDYPSDARLLAAATAVARLHSGWLVGRQDPGPCPAVRRRWQALSEWGRLIHSGWRPQPAADDPVGPHVDPAWERLSAAVLTARNALGRWLAVPVEVQPCLCDIWHDHALFTGDVVTGIIDFAAAKVDHVSVDLARLLGSLVPGDRERMEMALNAYRAIRPLSHPELVELLDWTGVVVAVTNWLRWLYHDGRNNTNRAAVAERIGSLVRRLENMSA